MTTALAIEESSGQLKSSADLSVKTRLVVELNKRTAADLTWLQEAEEVNKTTLVNRAIQVYRMIAEAQRDGGSLTIEDGSGSAPQRIVLI